MGQVKQAIMELEDFVAGCLREGSTLYQSFRDSRVSQAAKTNPYFDSEELVENKYYQFKGAE